MQLKKRNILLIIPLAAAAHGGPGPLALAAAGMALFLRDQLAGYLLLAVGAALAGSTGPGLAIASLSGAALALTVPSQEEWEATGSRRLLLIASMLLVLAPFQASALAQALFMLGVGALRYVRTMARLGRASITVRAEPEDPPVGGRVEIIVRVTGAGGSHVRVETPFAASAGACAGECVFAVRSRVASAGLTRVPVTVRIRDEDGFAELSWTGEAVYVGLYAVERMEEEIAEALSRVGAPIGELVAYELEPSALRVSRALWLEEAVRERAAPGGDYAGVREYQPGDLPKLVHWKKSASKGRLYTRLYTSGAPGRALVRARTLLYVDLRAASPEELDRLILEGYAAALALREDSILVMVTPGSIIIAAGPGEDVAHAYDAALRRLRPEPLWLEGDRKKPPALLGSLGRVIEEEAGRTASALAGEAEALGWTREGYLMVYGGPGLVLASRLSRELSSRGGSLLAEVYSAITSLPAPRS